MKKFNFIWFVLGVLLAIVILFFANKENETHDITEHKIDSVEIIRKHSEKKEAAYLIKIDSLTSAIMSVRSNTTIIINHYEKEKNRIAAFGIDSGIVFFAKRLSEKSSY